MRIGRAAWSRIALALGWAWALPVPAQAGPVNGLALYLGGVAARQGDLHSTGVSLGGDAQFTLNDRWSLNPCLYVSAEGASGSQRVSDGLGGIQVRHWQGNWFLGGQIFYHDRLLSQDGGLLSSQYGPGLGAVTGWEGPSGWIVDAQVDALEGQFFSPDDRRTALRVHVGYRWR